MKKSDTLTILAGLVITGIGWRYGGAQWGIPLAASAAIAFFLVHALWKENDATAPAQAQTTTDSFKQSLDNVGNPTQKVEQQVNVNFYPSEPSKSESPAVFAPPQIRPAVQRRTNLIFHKPKYHSITLDPDKGYWVLSEKSTIGSLLLPVYNDPKVSDLRAEYLKASITFTPIESPDSKIVIPTACWIKEQNESVTLDLGHEKLIVLIALGGNKVPSAIVNTARTFREHRMEYNEEWMEARDLPGREYIVEVCLIYGGGSQFKEFYEFSITRAGMMALLNSDNR